MISSTWLPLECVLLKPTTLVSAACLAVAIAMSYTYLWIQQLIRRKAQRPFRDIPYVVPNPHFLTGHLRLLGHDVVEGQRQVCCAAAGGPEQVCSFWTFDTPCFTVLHAGTVNRILKFTSDRTVVPGVARHIVQLFGKNSLILKNGKEWRASRDILQRSFSHAFLPHLQASVVAASLRVATAVASTIDTSSNQELETDLVTVCRIASLDVFGLAALGYDFGCTADATTLKESAVFRQLAYIQQEITRRCYHARTSLTAQLYWIPVSTNRKLARDNKALRKTLKDIIHRRRSEIEQSRDTATLLSSSLPAPANERNDFLTIAMKGSNVFSDLSDDVLSDWMVTVLFGGYDTTALALTYAVYLLAKNPEAQAECAAEVLRVDDWEKQRQQHLDPVKELPYLTACFWEAIRYYPPTAMTARTLHRELDLELDGKPATLPAGARCFFSLYWIQHSEMNFPRPDDYLPERWAQRNPCTGIWEERTPENDRQLHEVPVGNRNAIVAFSAGARNCVGQHLAVRMVVTMLASLVRMCHFEVNDPNYVLKLERYGASIAPVGGVPIRITSRREGEK